MRTFSTTGVRLLLFITVRHDLRCCSRLCDASQLELFQGVTPSDEVRQQ